MTDTTFIVPVDMLISQLAEVTATDGDCLVWIDPDVWVLTTDGHHRAESVAWFLEHGEWVNLLNRTCTTEYCIRADHHVDPAAAKPDPDDQTYDLVSRASRPRLADLYKRGVNSGLFTAGRSYQ